MAFNMEKLAEMAKLRSADDIESARKRRENRDWLHMSQDIALCVHYYLRNFGMTQKEFADRMGVSAVYVGKLLKGTENLTLETICKVQKALDEKLLCVFRPYIQKQIVEYSPSVKFSSNIVCSETYSEKKKKSDYVTAESDKAA